MGRLKTLFSIFVVPFVFWAPTSTWADGEGTTFSWDRAEELFGSYGLLDRIRTPRLREVLRLFDNTFPAWLVGDHAADAVADSISPDRTISFYTTVIPVLMTRMEYVFPKAKWVFVGDESHPLGHMLEAGFEAMGKPNRVFYLTGSESTFEGTEVNEGRMKKYLQNEGYAPLSDGPRIAFAVFSSLLNEEARQSFWKVLTQVFLRKATPTDFLYRTGLFFLDDEPNTKGFQLDSVKKYFTHSIGPGPLYTFPPEPIAFSLSSQNIFKRVFSEVYWNNQVERLEPNHYGVMKPRVTGKVARSGRVMMLLSAVNYLRWASLPLFRERLRQEYELIGLEWPYGSGSQSRLCQKSLLRAGGSESPFEGSGGGI